MVPAYAEFEVFNIPLEEFRSRWLPGLERDGLLVGLNWSGQWATGLDVEPASVQLGLTRRHPTSLALVNDTRGPASPSRGGCEHPGRRPSV